MARGTEAGDSRTINLETLFRTEDSSISGYEGFHLNVVMGFYAKLTLTVAPSQLASPGVLPIKCFCSVIKQTDIAWISCPSSEQVPGYAHKNGSQVCISVESCPGRDKRICFGRLSLGTCHLAGNTVFLLMDRFLLLLQ